MILPTPTPTSHPTQYEFTNITIFKEIESLGPEAFNRSYEGVEIKIGTYWDSGIADSSYYGVSVVQEPTEELVFLGQGSGLSWQYVKTEPHDGKVIIANGAYNREPSFRSYTCRVNDFSDGTLFLTRCVQVES